MRVATALGALLLLTPAALAAEERAAGHPLYLHEVLTSVETSFPLLQAVRAGRDAAEGSLQAAQGNFDLRLVAAGDVRPTGTYDNYSGEGRLEQNTQLWGARLYGGYRIGKGDFPSYEGDRQTAGSGEVLGGLAVPLLRGRSVDAPRARLQRAAIDARRAEPEIQLERIRFVRDASIAYWNWVAAGLEVGVARRLLEFAETRQEGLMGRSARGVVARIDLVDNERLIVDRRLRLLGAARDAEQAALDLSLFLRDAMGDPAVADMGRLPQDFPPEEPPDPDQITADLEGATRTHPLLRRLALQQESARVELELAQNDRLPTVDFRVEGAKGYGSSVRGISSEGSISSNPKGDTRVKAQIRFELPVQQREARGRAASAAAKLRALDRRERFARDRIEAEVLRAVAALETAYAQTGAARENLELARELQRAEERKLALGTSNLINVNIREIQAAEAAVALIETQAAYFRAEAEYRAAAGLRS